MTVSGSVTSYDLPDKPNNPAEVKLTITDDWPTVRSTDATRTTYDDYAYTEGAETPVDTFMALVPEGASVAWTVTGADAAQLTITDDGVLRFKKEPPAYPGTPDYEDENNPDGEYRVTVQAEATAPDGTVRNGSQPVTVAVRDAPGALCLSSSASACRPLTAPQVGQKVYAILEDPDGIKADAPVTWVWERVSDEEDPDEDWTPLNNPTASYTPAAEDVDHSLRVTVTYTDGDGTGIGTGIKAPAQVISDEPVTAAPDDSPRPPPSPPAPPGPSDGPPSGGPPSGGPPAEERPDPVGSLENPGDGSFQSGIGLISGWVCEAERVEIEIETAAGDTTRLEAAYGTARLDTARRPDGTRLCGDTDNGFGLLFNWNLLGDGEHTVVALVEGVELDWATVTVTTVGEGEEEEFLRSAVGECVVEDFPSPGETVRLAWQETNQNFVIASGTRPAGESRAGIAGVGSLENPGPNSFQSGIGLISGWVCDADTVEIALGDMAPQAAGYGTERLDTQAACGDTDNGFGLLFNWNLLGDGEHAVVASVDGAELGRATVRVTTLGAGAEEEFLRGAEGECVVADFPLPGQTVTLEWQQTSQNFVMTDVE